MATKKKRGPRGPRKYPEQGTKPSGIAADRNLLAQLLDMANLDPRKTVLQCDLPRTHGDMSSRGFLDRIEKAASGLLKLGIEKGARVAILAENRPEWTLSDFSIMAVGAVSVPIHTNLSPAQMAHQLRHSQVEIVFTSNGPHLQTLASVREKLPHLESLIMMDEGLPEGISKPDMTLTDLMRLGRTDRRPIEIMASRIGLEDPATIVYTSGTGTSIPRGVLLSHKNFLAEKRALEPVFNIKEGEVLLSYLPLAHILQRVVDMIALLGQGRLAYCSDIDQMEDKLFELRPHLLVGVPRSYEKIQRIIMDNLFYSIPPVKEAYQRVLWWMEQTQARGGEGGKIAATVELPMRWMKGRILRKIRERLGGRLRSCFVSGAPLPPDLESFFDLIEIPLFNLYGMTELTGAVTANSPDRYKSGTVGIPLPGCEVSVQDDGEILVRGDMVTPGYYRPGKQPGKVVNAKGWFPTGDLGRLDRDGFLVITGRKKNILITAAGKGISPQPIERRLRLNPFIKQAMVIGDGRKYLTALIVPSFQKLNEYALKNRILYLNHEELMEHPKIQALFHLAVSDVNSNLSRFETVKRFKLIQGPFAPEAGELTPTHRLRRKVIEKHYRDEIEAMYWGSD